ncbi:carbohydrate kinase family protein [Candidatus Daviesbacteria bacterium]|nr:carbohydrate kinase family protein [Candidatus Daviesbacteria bacterium]MBI4038476.1 carbohydrate kinase family protein [Candidatus Daviesbacteria bacterium]
MITVTGSLAFDHIMDYSGRFADNIIPDKIHQINLSFLLTDLKKQNGGTAGNIAYNLALLNSPSSILGCAGPDFSDYGKFLQDSGVDMSRVKKVDSLTSSAFIMTDLSDNQITGFYPGAMSQNSSLTLNGINSNLVVIAPNDPQAMIKYAKECQQTNTPYMIDPGMQLPALLSEQLKEMIKGATILIANDYEIALLKEKTDLNEQDLLSQVKILITTLGEKGSIVQKDSERYEINPAKPEKITDPTGAGDAYRAGFLAGWIKNIDLKVCGQMGSLAACYAVEKYGTTNHKFTIGEFCKRYRENFGEELKLS